MQRYISHILRARREAAGFTLKQAEALAGVDRSTLSRYERGEVRWPENLDGIVNGYAQMLEVPWVTLWREAIELAERDPTGQFLPRSGLPRIAGPTRARRARHVAP